MIEVVEKAADLDSRAVAAKSSEVAAEQLIRDFKPYLLGLAARYSPHYDEYQREEFYSTAMIAFYEAIQNYDASKGHFFPFAERVTRSRIIDSIRKIYRSEGKTVPLDNDDDEQTSAQSSAVEEISISQFLMASRQQLLLDEIEQFKAELSAWKITMDSLARQSPKRDKQREVYKKAIALIAKDPDIVQTIQLKRYFPIQAISEITGLPPKKLERARIFILSSLIIILGDYEVLSEYVGENGI
ncbi:MAG: hypothetical protein LBU61_00395 [Coriobacteriales bacterium]|jgi:RNA polymerase sigma factor|nr:hypothetical protein [Coriobacteriales bacterium]